jgi:hypothetical protein
MTATPVHTYMQHHNSSYNTGLTVKLLAAAPLRNIITYSA